MEKSLYYITNILTTLLLPAMSTCNQYMPTTRTKYTEGWSLVRYEIPSTTTSYQSTAASYPIKLESSPRPQITYDQRQLEPRASLKFLHSVCYYEQFSFPLSTSSKETRHLNHKTRNEVTGAKIVQQYQSSQISRIMKLGNKSTT